MKAARSILAGFAVMLALAPYHFLPAQDETDAKDAVISALTVLNGVKSFIATTVATNDSIKGTGTIIEIRVAAPDKYYSVVAGHGEKFESITIGKDTYINLGKKWEKSSEDSFGRLVDAVQCAFGDIPRLAIKNAGFVGEENVGGAKTRLYRYDIDEEFINSEISKRLGSPADKFPKPSEHKARVWINFDGLPVKIEDVLISTGTKQRPAPVTLKKVTTLKFDEKVIVEAPKI
jgi:hypothetical protein